jgi:diketogulonate reductase-like aldo/keto reductase
MDTAEAYGNGESEVMLGKALKLLDSETRKKIVIGSKIVPNKCGNVRKECEITLKRLDIECLDLYMVHWPISANSLGHFAKGKTSFGKSSKVEEADVPSTKKAFEELM